MSSDSSAFKDTMGRSVYKYTTGRRKILTDQQILEVRKLRDNHSVAYLAKRFDVSKRTIDRALHWAAEISTPTSTISNLNASPPENSPLKQIRSLISSHDDFNAFKEYLQKNVQQEGVAEQIIVEFEKMGLSVPEMYCAENVTNDEIKGLPHMHIGILIHLQEKWLQDVLSRLGDIPAPLKEQCKIQLKQTGILDERCLAERLRAEYHEGCGFSPVQHKVLKRAVGQGPFGRGINVPDIVLDSQAKERSTISDPVSGQVSDMQCSPLCIRESVERGHDRGSKRRADMLSNSDICPSKQAASLEDCDNRNNQNPHSVGRQKKKTRTEFDLDSDSDNGINSLLSMLIYKTLFPLI